MGKCLSCSQEDESSMQSNGHAVSNTSSVERGGRAAVSLPAGVATVTKYPDPAPPVPSRPPYEDLPPPHAARPQSAMDKKIFSQYPKLPPIRKPSTGSEVKRTSFSLGRDYSETKIAAMFDTYKDADDPEVILAEGIEKLCVDLDVRPEEFKVLVLAWKFNAETMCRFTKAEFVSGCRRLRVDSIRGIQQQFPELLDELVNNKDEFKSLYRWTYKFGLDADTGQRTLPADMAVSLWRLVFSERKPAIIDQWLDFLERHQSVRGIPKDTWDMFYNFIEAVGDDLSCYDDTEAWPSLFDDFVEYENDRQNQNVKVEKGEIDYYD